MALAVVGAVANQVNSVSAVTLTRTMTAGHLVVCIFRQNINNTSTLAVDDSSAGSNTWNQLGSYVSATNATDRFCMFWSSLAADVTWVRGTWSGALSGTIIGILYDITGHDTSNPVDSDASNPAASSDATSGLSLTSGALSTVSANCILLFGVAMSAAGGTEASFTPDTAGGFAIWPGGAVSNGNGAMEYKIVSTQQSSLTTSISWPTTNTNRDGIFAAFREATAVTVTQSGFLFRDDNGSESGASSLAAANVDITRAKLTNTRLRVQIDTAGDAPGTQYQLEYRKQGDIPWTKV